MRVYERQTRWNVSALLACPWGDPVVAAGVVSTTLHPGGDAGGSAEAAVGAMAARPAHRARLTCNFFMTSPGVRGRVNAIRIQMTPQHPKGRVGGYAYQRR